MLESVEWGEFRVGDLFDVATVKGIDEGRLELHEKYEKGLIEFVGRTEANYGVKGYVKQLFIKPNEKNVFSISQVGTIIAQLRKNTWYGSQNIFKLKPKNMNIKLLSFGILAALNKMLFSNYENGYSNYPTLKKLKKNIIKLPICKDGAINFSFMEKFIAELEDTHLAELEDTHLAELEAYLRVAGLKDYKLTEEEVKVLDDFEKGNIQWDKITYSEVFNKIIQGRRLKKDDQINGNIPFVMSGTTNTGVVGYISNHIITFPKNSITIDIFGNSFYRSFEYSAGDDTGVYWNDEINYTKESMLFFTTSMEKSIYGKFNYGKKLRSSRSYEFNMQVPFINNNPDYELMDTFISAIQKLVIKDVVLFTDKKLALTKQAIDNN